MEKNLNVFFLPIKFLILMTQKRIHVFKPIKFANTGKTVGEVRFFITIQTNLCKTATENGQNEDLNGKW